MNCACSEHPCTHTCGDGHANPEQVRDECARFGVHVPPVADGATRSHRPACDEVDKLRAAVGALVRQVAFPDGGRAALNGLEPLRVADEALRVGVEALREARTTHEWPVETDDGLNYSRCSCGAKPPYSPGGAEDPLWMADHHDEALVRALLAEPAPWVDESDFIAILREVEGDLTGHTLFGIADEVAQRCRRDGADRVDPVADEGQAAGLDPMTWTRAVEPSPVPGYDPVNPRTLSEDERSALRHVGLLAHGAGHDGMDAGIAQDRVIAAVERILAAHGATR